MTQLNANGHNYSDDGTGDRDLTDDGHRAWLLPMFTDTIQEMSNLLAGVSASGTRYLFDPATAAADPGAGYLRASSPTLNTATAIHVDDLNAAGDDVTAWLAQIAASTSPVKGRIGLRNPSGVKWAAFNVTGATDAGGFYSLAVTYLAPVTPPAFDPGESVILLLDRTGDQGEPGVVSAAGDGTVNAPGIAFGNEPGLGLRRKSGGLMAVTAAGADVLELRRPTAGEIVAGAAPLPVMTLKDTADAIAALAKVGFIRVARTDNAALAAADKGRYIDITANSFTQTFASAASLGGEWSVMLGNSGTGDIALDPNGSDLIDGLTGFVMYPGELRLITCDGVSLRTVVISGFVKAFDSSGSWTTPPGYTVFEVTATGGGGGGGSGSKGDDWSNPVLSGGIGGSGGQTKVTRFVSAALSTTVTVTIGAGGLGGSSKTADATGTGGNNGNNGGTSYFGALLEAVGGAGGQGGQTGNWPVESPSRPGEFLSILCPLFSSGSGGTYNGNGSGAGASGGGPGGGKNTQVNGGSGGRRRSLVGVAGGALGLPGAPGINDGDGGAGGGAGGAYWGNTTAGAGGVGGRRGGGGGGGGLLNRYVGASGAGGQGGAGCVIVTGVA